MTTTIEKSVEIDAPIAQAYALWADVAQYPGFMDHIVSVEAVDGSRWRWQAETNGKQVEWETELTEQVPQESIGWQTTGKSTRCSTTVRFETLDDGRTAVTFTAHYPNGVGKGQSAADIAQQAEQTLQRFSECLLGDDVRGADQQSTDTEDSEPQDQSTSDVLGPSYSFRPQGPALGSSWRESAALGSPALKLGESALARSLEAMMAFNPLLPVPRPRSVVQHAWFSSMFQAMEAPFNAMKRFSEELDRGMEAFMWGGAGKARQIWAVQDGAAWTPSVDVDQTEEALKVRADLPGVSDQDELEVEVRDGQLVISGELRHPVEAEGQEADRPMASGEQPRGRFVRTITLPAGVDAVGAQASLHDGVLEVTLAGPALRQNRRIEVNHGQQPH